MWENERITAVFWGYLTNFAFLTLIFAVFGVFYGGKDEAVARGS